MSLIKASEKKSTLFGLKPKLFLLVLLSFGILIGLIYFQIKKTAEKVADETIEKSLKQSTTILSASLKSKYDSYIQTAQNLSRDATIFPDVYAKQSASLQDRSIVLQKSVGYSLMIVTDANGFILARSDKPAAQGRLVKGRSHLFDQALSGNNVYGIMRRKTELLQVVCVPIFDNVATDIVRGSLAIAFRLSDQLAKEIHELTGGDIGFFTFPSKKSEQKVPIKQYFTSDSKHHDLMSQFNNMPDIWQSLKKPTSLNQKALLQLNKETYQGIFVPLKRSDGNPEGFMIALRSRAELMRPFLEIQQKVVFYSIICLFLGGILSMFLANNIASPIVELSNLARKIQDGLFPSFSPSARKDEIGLLQTAFFAMTKSLKEKAEIENYLAEISDNLVLDEGLTISIKESPSTAELPSETDKTLISTQNRSQSGKIPVDQFIPGDIFDKRYSIKKGLGKGAMGVVYLAQDTELNEMVALKLISSEKISENQEDMERFKEEIRLARKITHRNILRTYDFGNFDKISYITMEFVNGFDLNDLLLKKGPLGYHMGIILAKQMCSAIKAAHDEGIIHRDLKPQNMMISQRGVLKVMDFGLAMKVDSTLVEKVINENEIKDNMNASNTSQDGVIAGTPFYMSPEQFLGQDLDKRTDIYSIGVILFKMFTGRLPFESKQLMKLAKQHIKEIPPKISTLTKEIPPLGLEDLIDKALSKSKDDRFSDISEIQIGLNQIG